MKIKQLETIYYFAYGMLTDPKNMSNADYMGLAALNNFQLELLSHANIVPSSNSTVYGTLWALDQNMLNELDIIEGYPDYYNRIQVPVTHDNQRYTAQVYVMTESSRQYSLRSLPRPYYLEQIITGYKHAGVPQTQLVSALERAKQRVDKYKDEDQ